MTEEWMTKQFLLRALVLGLVVGALRLVFEATRVPVPPESTFVELLLLGIIVLHKWSVPIEWLTGSVHSPLKCFFRSFGVYFLPAAVLGSVLIAYLFHHYLPLIVIIPEPIPELVMMVSLYGIAQGLLGPEILQLRRPKQ
jgi:hypothetical protein